MKDWLAVIGALLVIALCLAAIPLMIWVHVWAPCRYVDWLPAKDVPARCFVVNQR